MENCFHDIKSLYVQCTLQRKHRCGGMVTETAFIPKQLAHKGANLRIRVNGKWEEGWQITEVGSERVGVPDVQRRRAERVSGKTQYPQERNNGRTNNSGSGPRQRVDRSAQALDLK